MRFLVADVLTGRVLGVLPVTEYALPATVVGAGTGQVGVNVNAAYPVSVADLRNITTPDTVALVMDNERGQYLWSGIITDRNWERRKGMLTLEAQEVKGWFYSAVQRAGDYLVTATEQATILSALATAALATPGVPEIVVQTPVATGVLRDATVRQWANVGEAMDSIGGRAGGMEWWVDCIDAATKGYLVWRWRAALARQSRPLPVAFVSNPDGGNITDYSWPESAKERRSRVTSLGEGSPPDQAAATDEDPDLAGGTVLLREQVTGPYTGVTQVGTLFDHSNAEREARNHLVQSVTVKALAAKPDTSTYDVGDYARLRIQDDWLNVDVPNVRIISRTLSGGRGKPDLAELVLDLNDDAMPDTSSGVDDV